MHVLEPDRLSEVFALAQGGSPLAVVTGAAGGIGVAITQSLTSEGYAVIASDINANGLERSYPDDQPVALVTQDVSSGSDWGDLATEIQERAGRLDALVNNAGSLQMSSTLEDCPEEEFRRVIDINLVGTFLGIRACTPLLRHAPRGAIVNFSSGEAYHATPGNGAYTASKWAVRGLTKTAAVELAVDGVRCNSVHPWGIDSAMLRGPDGTNSVSELVAKVPMGRVGLPEEVGALVAFLVGPASTYSTGSEFVIDGGVTAWSGF
jgi:3alpha(or 20beta)-hydroxysteroid dehydrogenase